MNYKTLCEALAASPDKRLWIKLPDGKFVPAHFHITEVGRVQKDFIDCGGTHRTTATCVLQVWVAHDLEHRLTTTKAAHILRLASGLDLTELPVEIEYEADVVSQYPLRAASVTDKGLILEAGVKHTDCLAPDKCGVGQGCC